MRLGEFDFLYPLQVTKSMAWELTDRWLVYVRIEVYSKDVSWIESSSYVGRCHPFSSLIDLPHFPPDDQDPSPNKTPQSTCIRHRREQNQPHIVPSVSLQ